MQRKKKVTRVIVIIVFIVGVIVFINPILRYRNYQLRNAIQSASYQDKDTLEKMIPFKWDFVVKGKEVIAYVNAEDEKPDIVSRIPEEVKYGTNWKLDK